MVNNKKYWKKYGAASAMYTIHVMPVNDVVEGLHAAESI